VNHKICIDKESKIIYCALEGELDIEKSISLSKSLREKASELGFNVLYEANKLQEPISDTPVHDLTVKLSSILDATILREVMVAFVYEYGTYDEYWQFYEKAATERGLKIKVFTDKEEAEKWLAD